MESGGQRKRPAGCNLGPSSKQTIAHPPRQPPCTQQAVYSVHLPGVVQACRELIFSILPTDSTSRGSEPGARPPGTLGDVWRCLNCHDSRADATGTQWVPRPGMLLASYSTGDTPAPQGTIQAKMSGVLRQRNPAP